jgi:acylpyruvate hydrolase
MKLVTFYHNAQIRLGVFRTAETGETIIDVNRINPELPTDMIGFLEAAEEARTLVEQAVATAPSEAIFNRADVTLKAPIPRPGKIMCIGLNYRDHAAETNKPIPEYPTVFSKYANTVIGPGEAIVIPQVTNQVDYEVELAVVIGRRARHVSKSEALDYVGGYMPFNDVSARDYQNRTTQWTIGKTFDTFAPMGPALVTADEVQDPHNLNLRLSIGDEVLQSSNTRNLIFSIHDLIAYLSAVMTLEPGDVISTGTPSGVGAARQPQRFLQPGEVVRIEIEGLGILENPVVAE